MRKRAFIIILAFPVLALLWLIGWFSYRVGSRSTQDRSQNEETIMKEENLSEPMAVIAAIDEDLLTTVEEG